MKHIFYTLLLSLLCWAAAGQLATYNWAVNFGNTVSSPVMVMDAADNAYFLFTASGPVTIGTTTYNADYRSYVVKYSAGGAILWSKGFKAYGSPTPGEVVPMSIGLAEDSLSLLVCGYSRGEGNSLPIDANTSVGGAFYAAGFLLRLDANTGNGVWARNFNILQANNFLTGNETRITQVSASAAGIFTISSYINKNVVRKHDLQGNEVWNRAITTTQQLSFSPIGGYADDGGNTLYSVYSDNANNTAITFNNITYTVPATVNYTYFSLDSSGKTLWARPNINAGPGKGIVVQRNGDVFINASIPYPNNVTANINPFLPGFCNTGNAFFKGNLKTGSLQFAMPNTQSGLVVKQGMATQLVSYNNTRNPIAGANGLFRPAGTKTMNQLTYNTAGEPQSASTLYSFTGTLPASILQWYLNRQRQYVALIQKSAATEMTFANGNLPAAANASYLLLSFTPGAAPTNHTTTWTGSSSGAWFTVANWTNGIPTDSSTAIIPPNATRYPTQDNEFYNFSTSSWAKCGTLVIQPGVTYKYGYGATITGVLVNDGTITYNYLAGYAYYLFTGWGATQFVGNGQVVYTGGGGSTWGYKNHGHNKIVINLGTAASTIAMDCMMADSLQLLSGNIIATAPANGPVYVHNGITWGANGQGGASAHVALPFVHRLVAGQPLQLQTGSGTNAQPMKLTLANPSRINNVRVSFSTTISGAQPNTTVNGQSVGSLLNGGIWTITPDTTLEAGNSYNLSVYLKGSTNATNANNYALLKRDNAASAWQAAGSYVAARDSADYTIASATGVGGFSDFGIGISAVSLPFRSVRLQARQNQDTHELSWAVIATEVETMDIERGADGRLFLPLHHQAFVANGNYSDRQPLPGASYYRLRLTDRSGQTAYSNVVMLRQSDSRVLVYPTVARESFSVQLTQTRTVRMSVSAATGTVIHQQVMNGGGTYEVSCSHWAAGTYFCRFLSTDGSVLATTTVVKQ